MSTTLSTTTVGASRIGYETRSYFRSPDAVFFTFLFPVIMLGIFTAAFSSSGEIQPGPGAEGVSGGAYYLPGMLAAGLLLSGVQNLAVEIAGRAERGREDPEHDDGDQEREEHGVGRAEVAPRLIADARCADRGRAQGRAHASASS